MDNERTRLLDDQGQGSQEIVEQCRVCTENCTCSPKCRLKLSCGAVLLTEVLERIAFYGLVGNLVMFLNKNPLAWSSYNAANALFVFTGISYLTSLFGGWLADAVLGKFKTIFIFFILYIAGYALFPNLVPYPAESQPLNLPAWCGGAQPGNPNATIPLPTTTPNWYIVQPGEKIPSPGEENCSWQIYLSLVIMGLGNGVIKANIAPFGADQVKSEGPVASRTFFNWFYWCINVGAPIALGPIAYIQQNISFFWGYIISSICLCLAATIFLCGRAVYNIRPSGGSVLSGIIHIFFEGCQRCIKRKRVQATRNRERHQATEHASSPGCLDYAKVRHGGSFHHNSVEDVKRLSKIFFIFLSLIPYWVVYFQMETTFLLQGLHMRLDFSNDNNTKTQNAAKFKIPAAWLSLFDVLVLIVLIPVLDRIIYPHLDKKGYHLTMRWRIVLGMLFGLAAVCCAGAVETYRHNVFWFNNTKHDYVQIIGQTEYHAANVSILWQIPQYALVGVSEVFASVAGLEMAYRQAPKSMQGIIMGLFWMSQGFGSMLGTATVYWFQGVFFHANDHGDISCKECHLEYYYFFLAGLLLAGIVIFVVLAWKLDVGRGSERIRIQGRYHHSAVVQDGARSRLGDIGSNDSSQSSPTSSVLPAQTQNIQQSNQI